MQYTINTSIGPLVQFAASYDCNAYGRGTYNNSDCTTTTDPNAPPQDGGLLPDTGWNIIIPVTLALALILAASILFAKKLIRHHKSQ